MNQAEKSRALAFIVFTVTINMIGVGIAWPVLPKLVQEMGNVDLSSAAYTYAFIGIVFAISQFLFSPLLGNLSDRFGRKPVLIVSLFGLGFDYLLTALAPTYFWLAVVRFVGGMFAATITTANAYAADISTPEDRARNFGFIGAAFGVGFILGPLLGGWLGSIDIRYPFYAAAALALANGIFGWIILPESLADTNRRKFDLSETNPIRALKRVAAFPSLSALLISLFITATAQRGLEATWVLYVDFRFGWDIRQAAWSLAFVGIMYFIVQGFAVGPIVKRYGEWRTVIAGFSIAGFSFLFYAVADQGWMMYPLIALYAIGNGIGAPALNAICSKTVPEDRQGQLQGALQSVNAMAVIIGPFAASIILGHVSSSNPMINLPGAWFVLCGIAFAIALWLTIRANQRLKLAGHP
ncbi:MAG: TCR/Tet family MFS transporter [Ahrensia sp.]|nr:TCR/Tet family MFS transporter [Ahrensia sp.]